MPTNPTGPELTSVDVTPGTHEHKVHVEEHAEPQEERRRTPSPVNVQVGQPPSGGLTGWAATIANMSAVAFVMVFMFIVYQDFRSNVKEDRASSREERAKDRESVERNTTQLVEGLKGQTVVMNAELRTLEMKIEALVLAKQTLIVELKNDRLALEAKLTLLISEIQTLIKEIKAKACAFADL